MLSPILLRRHSISTVLMFLVHVTCFSYLLTYLLTYLSVNQSTLQRCASEFIDDNSIFVPLPVVRWQHRPTILVQQQRQQLCLYSIIIIIIIIIIIAARLSNRRGRRFACSFTELTLAHRDFFIIAPYKYSYLLTYLLTYVLIYLLVNPRRKAWALRDDAVHLSVCLSVCVLFVRLSVCLAARVSVCFLPRKTLPHEIYVCGGDLLVAFINTPHLF